MPCLQTNYNEMPINIASPALFFNGINQTNALLYIFMIQ
jgi:hypothetical protein